MVSIGARNHTTVAKGSKKRLYPCHKTKNHIAEVVDKVNFLFADKSLPGQIYFLTLTTQQSLTGLLDKTLLYALRLFLQHKSKTIRAYVQVVERQRNTGDLHFHIIYKGKKLRIEQSLKHWSTVVNAAKPNHPALLDVKRVTSSGMLQNYLAKYVVKRCPSMNYLEKWYNINPEKYKPPYSSLFWCRMSTGSQMLSKKNREYKTKFRIPTEFIKYLPTQRVAFGDFYDLYHYSEAVEKRVKWLYSAFKRAGLEI